MLANLDGSLTVCPDPFEAATGAQVVAVLTEWPQYADLDFQRLADLMAPNAAIVDARNLLSPDTVKKAGLGYDAVGRS